MSVEDLDETIEKFRAQMVADLIKAEAGPLDETIIEVDALPGWRVSIIKSRVAAVWLARVQKLKRDGWNSHVSGAKAFDDAFEALTCSYACLHELANKRKGSRMMRPWRFMEKNTKLTVVD